jgi:hypothetical protein
MRLREQSDAAPPMLPCVMLSLTGDTPKGKPMSPASAQPCDELASSWAWTLQMLPSSNGVPMPICALSKVLRLEAQAPEEGVDAALPAVGEVAGVPVERVFLS